MLRRLMISLVSVLMLSAYSYSEFDDCSFNFGTDWDYANENQNTSATEAVDYITIWLNDPSFNTYWHGDMLDFCKDNGKTPVFYAYIIAKTSGLGDGDVGGGLPTEGAAYLRDNFEEIKSVYDNYASEAANRYGTSDPIIWLMEPDYYQYFSGDQSVDLSFSDASDYMNELIDVVKSHLPNAQFSLDISPWNNDQATYINSFDMSKFSFMHTSGGRTEAGSDRIRSDDNNLVTWSEVSEASGKPIIADDGYGVGGGSTGHATDWDDENNLKARIADGVAAITQKSPDSNWGSTISSLNDALSGESIFGCGGSGTDEYNLSLSSDQGGSVSVSPDQNTYESGTQVTLTANPDNGYTFSGWSGAASGSDATTTITMDSDKSVTASFEAVTEEYSLTVNSGQGGSVSLSPEQNTYESGTDVTLTANPENGYTFTGWSEDASGSGTTTTITMDSDKSVTASFEEIPEDQYTVSVSVNGSGSVTRSPDQGSYEEGAEVTLTAEPREGVSVFDGWSGEMESGEASITVTVNSDIDLTAAFTDTGSTNSTLKVEAEDYDQQSGDNMVVESEGDVTNIGYIESGYSTTYNVNVQTAGEYLFNFRVASGLESSTFDVIVDGDNVGSITFDGTNDNARWNEYTDVELSNTVDLSQGDHTIELSFQSAVNVDYFELIQISPVTFKDMNRTADEVSGPEIRSKASGFSVSFYSGHEYNSYTLYSVSGKVVRRGMISKGREMLSFSGLSSGVLILSLNGKTGTRNIRVSVPK